VTAPLRVLQLVSRDDVGGVRLLTDVIGDGLRAEGVTVETLALIGGSRIGKLGHLARVLSRVVTGRYDAIFAYHAAASVVAGIVGPLAGVPLRLSHLTAIPSAIRPHWRWADRALGVAGGYQAIIANSAPTQAAFAGHPAAYRDRIRLIPHGVPPLPVGQALDWRQRLGVRPGRAVLVASGRLAAQKDFATAIRALPLLPDAELAIAGDGEQRAMLSALAAELGVTDRLHLVGSLPRNELPSFLAAGDCYLFPSVWETFGLAGAEAQMLGLPIVATDLPVLAEVLWPAGLVRFHPVGDATALAAAVLDTLKVPPNAATRAATARAAAAQHSVAKMIQSYMALLAPAVGSRA
jgi:glycosyltransferase involved in cell wall biosynthesis